MEINISVDFNCVAERFFSWEKMVKKIYACEKQNFASTEEACGFMRHLLAMATS
jgi:hypothetical protein